MTLSCLRTTCVLASCWALLHSSIAEGQPSPRVDLLSAPAMPSLWTAKKKKLVPKKFVPHFPKAFTPSQTTRVLPKQQRRGSPPVRQVEVRTQQTTTPAPFPSMNKQPTPIPVRVKQVSNPAPRKVVPIPVRKPLVPVVQRPVSVPVRQVRPPAGPPPLLEGLVPPIPPAPTVARRIRPQPQPRNPSARPTWPTAFGGSPPPRKVSEPAPTRKVQPPKPQPPKPQPPKPQPPKPQPPTTQESKKPTPLTPEPSRGILLFELGASPSSEAREVTSSPPSKIEINELRTRIWRLVGTKSKQVTLRNLGNGKVYVQVHGHTSEEAVGLTKKLLELPEMKSDDVLMGMEVKP